MRLQKVDKQMSLHRHKESKSIFFSDSFLLFTVDCSKHNDQLPRKPNETKLPPHTNYDCKLLFGVSCTRESSANQASSFLTTSLASSSVDIWTLRVGNFFRDLTIFPKKFSFTKVSARRETHFKPELFDAFASCRIDFGCVNWHVYRDRWSIITTGKALMNKPGELSHRSKPFELTD